MRTLFTANPFEVGLISAPRGRGLGQGQQSCVLIGTLSHKADGETLFDRTEQKYTNEGWDIVREKTGRVHFAGTKDEVEETNIWACPPEPKNEQFLGQVPLILGPSSWGSPAYQAPGVCPPGSVDINGACMINPVIPGAPPPVRVVEPYLGQPEPSGRMTPYNGGPAYWNDGTGGYIYCDPAKDPNCPPQGVRSTSEMGATHPQGPHWARYGNERVRWPDCDPRYDANCPFPTSVITEQMNAMSIGQTGVVSGFGGPGGGFGFGGGPGGLVGPVAGAPSPGSGPITGPSIPCGPAGGPTCPPDVGLTIMQNVYPIQGVLGRRALGRGGGGGGGGGRGHGGFRGGYQGIPGRGASNVICGPGNWGPECSYPVENLGKGPLSHGKAAQGHDRWYHPDGPCPPGYFRSSPGSPCVAPGDLVDNGENYFGNPWV